MTADALKKITTDALDTLAALLDEGHSDHPLRKVMAARLNSLRRIDVRRVFAEIVSVNAARVSQLANLEGRGACDVQTGDARHLPSRPSKLGRASLLLTSPPYMGAQKYVRAASLSLNWLGLIEPTALRTLERLTVGREHLNLDEQVSFEHVPAPYRRVLRRIAAVNPLRAQIAAHYLADLRAFFDQLSGSLTARAHCVMVIGSNTVCGMPFDTPGLARMLGCESGLSLVVELTDEIKSRGLMTSRNRGSAVIDHEHVLVWRRTH